MPRGCMQKAWNLMKQNPFADHVVESHPSPCTLRSYVVGNDLHSVFFTAYTRTCISPSCDAILDNGPYAYFFVFERKPLPYIYMLRDKDNEDICSAPRIYGIVLCAHLLNEFNVDMKYEHIQDPILVIREAVKRFVYITCNS
jgi:hypothetical protein